MTTTSRSTVVGVFRDREEARQAIEALKADGFHPDTISILSPDKAATESIAEETGTHAGSGAATGALAGGILGGLGGWLLGIGALAIPGIGPFIAAGAFASALGGAAIGAGVGAIAGALTGMGVPEEHAEYYEGEAKAGKTLVTVRADNRYDDAQRILRDHGAYDVESRDAAAGFSGNPVLETAGATELRGADARGATQVRETDVPGTVELREEQLVAQKDRVETGKVRVGKQVVSEERTLEVPVTREEVTIDRHPVDRRPTDRPIDERGEMIEVPVREEQVEVEKRAVVYEEVSVGTREVQESRSVSDTVRREEARIESTGDVNTAGGVGVAGSRWEQAMPGYRERWQQHATTGERWEDVEPSYRYGYEMRSRPDYANRQWSEVEPEIRQDWTRRNPSTPWDKASGAVRETWENATTR